MKAATALSRMLSLRGGGVPAAGFGADFRAGLRADLPTMAASIEIRDCLN
ncbi:MAG TPA: hypothetical protein VNQ31_07715 [Sphingomonadaceae bacterium]|nr:hypothetical protein [Sphingomonadaceae bacterium]